MTKFQIAVAVLLIINLINTGITINNLYKFELKSSYKQGYFDGMNVVTDNHPECFKHIVIERN